MTIEVRNLDTVIKQLQKYRDDIDRRMKNYLEALADLGYSTAGARLKSAIYDGDISEAAVNAPIWLDDKTLVVSATGSIVWFVEFGTGITYPDDHPKAAEMGAVRGSYGERRGNQASWGYYGEPGTNGKVTKNKSGDEVVITRGNPANRFMYDASKEMRNQYVELARRYFSR